MKLQTIDKITIGAFLILMINLLALDNAKAAVTYEDYRYCGQPARDPETNRILRDRKQVYAFRKFNPCPIDGNLHKACPGWSVDHVRPLASCGCDDPNNMQWLPVQIKSCAGIYCKDRWERRVYVCKDTK